MGQEWNHRRERELQAFAAVCADPPKGLVRHRDIDNPLGVAREVQIISGNSGKKRKESPSVAVVAHKFGAWKPSIGKQLLAVRARNAKGELHWPGCELHG